MALTNNNQLFTIQNFIDGEFVSSEKYIDSYDPSTDEVWVRVPDSQPDEVDLAVKAAKLAFDKWSVTTPEERSRVMMKIADNVESRLDKFAEMESRDQGKPVSLAAKVDIPRVVNNFRFFATAILHKLNMSTFMEEQYALNYTCRHPVGVAGLISPWNLPLYLLSFKIAPAIACGNTVVCKPSEMTSVSAWMLCEIFNISGLPKGVVNMVFGTGWTAGDTLVRHVDVPLISFTGSTVTAEKIQMATAPYCKRLSLELGGKNAAIIFDDADLTKCIPTVIRSSFINQGEVCLATSRLFVQRTIFDRFLKMFVTAADNIKVGRPQDPDTWMGALISKEHMAKVQSYINLAASEGGHIQTRHEANRLNLPYQNSKGYFIPPTVITGVQDTSRLMQEEIFGPVVCVVPFDTEEEVIKRANNVKYGLCASIWSTNINRMHRVAKKLDVGTAWGNCWLVRDLHMPFGGTKSSGLGREGFYESVEFFTEVKTVCVQLDQTNGL